MRTGVHGREERDGRQPRCHGVLRFEMSETGLPDVWKTAIISQASYRAATYWGPHVSMRKVSRGEDQHEKGRSRLAAMADPPLSVFDPLISVNR